MIFQITLAHTAARKHTARTEVDRGREEVRLGAGADAGAGNGWDELDWGGGEEKERVQGGCCMGRCAENQRGKVTEVPS